MAIIEAKTLCQVAFVVHDLDAAIKKYQETFGLADPWFLQTEGYEKTKATYNGEPLHGTARLAFFKMGQIEIELIQPDDKPSVWREHLDAKGEGIHHIAFFVKDSNATEAALEPLGIPLKQKGYGDDGGSYAYVDSAAKLGVMIELLE